MSADGIALIDLYSSNAWVFQFFPPGISTEDRANWEPQNVTIGTRPLFYSNREPQRITISDVLLNSDSEESITKDIEELRALMKETDRGSPPPLLFICGDWQERVVLEELRIEKQFFDPQANLLRARVSLTLLELQRVRERVTTKITDVEPDVTRPRRVG
jgi:hypothetical protein